MRKYSCEVKLLVELSFLRNFLREILHETQFIPYRMDVHYNEFKDSTFQVSFEEEFLIKNMALKEMGGITSFTVYDKYYQTENPTPFFRFRLNDVSISTTVFCTLEWISFDTLEWFINKEVFSRLLSSKVSLAYAYLYDQKDAFDQNKISTKRGFGLRSLVHESDWGKKVIVRGYTFMAAPICYFGKEFYDIIPEEVFLSLDYSQSVKINGHKLVEVRLFQLNERPQDSKNRKKQKEFWKKTKLQKAIDGYRVKTAVDFAQFLKNRAKKSKSN